MPGLSRLSDQELAEITSFVGENWAYNAAPVSASQVKKLRVQLNHRADDSPDFETPRPAAILAKSNADRLVRGMRLRLETSALLPQNVGDFPNCMSCHLKVGTVADSPPHTNAHGEKRHNKP